MLFHYVKLAFRLLVRNPRFSLINTLGLATGFAAFLILWPYAQEELHTDQFHKDYDQIARLGSRVQLTVDGKNWTEWTTAGCFWGGATMIKNRFSEVIDLTRLVPQKAFKKEVQGSDPKVLISLRKENDQKVFFSEKTVAYAEANFFRFFSFPLALGSADQILARPATVALSETVAKKYFASANPMDKVIYLNDSLPFRVSGVFKDLPKNTHFQLDILLSTAGIQSIDVFNWDLYRDWGSYSYVKVKDGNFTALETKLKASSKELFGPLFGAQAHPSYLVDPLTQLSFINRFDYAFKVKSRQPLVLLNVIAFVILGMAWINYVSLSIHQLRKRLSEIGTRKVVGASAKHLALQFLVEAALLNGISFLLALTLVQLSNTGVERWFGIYLISWADLPASSVTLIGLVLLGGMLITGLYPVWIALAYKPLQLLRKLKTYRSPRWVNGVVTLQYTCAIVLLIWITAVYAQINFILNKDLGIDKQAVVVVDSPIRRSPAFERELRTFLHQVRTLPGVGDVTFSVSVMGDDVRSQDVRKNRTAMVVPLDNSGGVDEHFIPLYHIQLLAGRNFGPDQPADQKTVLLSETAVKRMGYRRIQEALGSTIFLPGEVAVEVIGIYRDYEFRPLLNGVREEGRGSILTYKRNPVAYMTPEKISVKINTKAYQATIEGLKNTYTASFGDSLFEWRFLEEHLEKQYVGEQLARNQIALFTVIAIFIACLGLLGMITNKADQKIKEIGIRKIVGAKPHHIAKLLLKATLIQVVVSTLVGIPLAKYLIKEYLETFSERVSLLWWHYGFALLILLLLMFGTIISVLRKAANRNPAEALRYE
ncbi:FtsX-like permease family protein [Rhodocytophaga rosea]|uniref:FtsX-like permease family protein n=1 Tax=Rhodocytophaga rosea TaxID=2704465 RepID=A0A6C0GI50_9BACT|nr:ABC transporter permease [Rhodocytophaga rosea]QHT67362.1 FtsX-like permease family protein [Rhodocytophaga rosea]